MGSASMPLVLWLLLGGALAEKAKQQSLQQSLEAAWDRELNPESKVKKYESPIKRVTNLLMQMKEQLVAEADKESEMYDKMVCWCQENQKAKTAAIAEAEAKDRDLSAEIETRSARAGELKANIADSQRELGENTEALNTATTVRENEAAKFRGDEKDLMQAVVNLRNAIAVLSKHQKTQALLQIDGTVVSGLRVILRDAALKYELLVAGREERNSFKQRAHGVALVALKSAIQRVSGGADQGIEGALLSALNLQDNSVSDALPLKFAQQLVERAAQPPHKGAQGAKFLQVDQPIFESRSSQRSSEIYGILTQMLEEFEAQLSTEQKAELQAQGDFKAVAAAKSAEIEAGKAKIDEMQGEGAGNAKALSDANENLDLTREQRSADVTFLQNLQTQCNDLNTEWEKRSKTRAAETQAVSEAIAVLTEDDNRELLHRAVTLLQISSASEVSAMRASAAAVLRRAANSPSFEADDLLAAWHSRRTPTLGAAAGPRAQLSTLAMAVQLDSFTKVKEMMDKMIENLKKEQQDEVNFKAYCTKELNENEKTVYAKNEVRKDLETKMSQLQSLIKKLEEDIAAANKQIADTQLEIKKSSQNRENENTEFQRIVADQRATQSVLQKALQKLKDFYEKKIGNVMLQAKRQEPPVKFNAFKTHSGAPAVISLLDQILGDSKALEAETTKGEYKAQAEYESFVKNSNQLIAGLQEQITANTKAMADAKGDLGQATSDHQSTVSELESLAAYEADLHNQCDFVLKNFDIRQKARLQEIEAIQGAKAILSGEGK